MNNNNIYDMKLHEVMSVGNFYLTNIYITRVPGGWIYSDTYNEKPTSVFVPFNNEFMENGEEGDKDYALAERKIYPGAKNKIDIDEEYLAICNKKD
jgi:hypothetical protein